MRSVIFHFRRPTTQENDSYKLDFYVLGDIHISHFEVLLYMFFTSLHTAPRFMY